MSKFNIKTLVFLEALVLFLLALFTFDFLPRNYEEFYGICSQTWPKDPKQYQICLEPYFSEIKTDKYGIGFGVVVLVVLPIVYVFKKK